MSELDVAIEKMHGSLQGLHDWLADCLICPSEDVRSVVAGASNRIEIIKHYLSQLKAVAEKHE